MSAALLVAVVHALPPITVDLRVGFGGTDAVGGEGDAVASFGLEAHVEVQKGLHVGFTSDVAGSGKWEDVSHGHLGVLFGIGRRRGVLRGTLFSELGVHGIGGVGDEPTQDASTVRFGYLGVRGGAELISAKLPIGVGVSLSLRRDLVSQDGWMVNPEAPGLIAITAGGTEVMFSLHAGARF